MRDGAAGAAHVCGVKSERNVLVCVCVVVAARCEEGAVDVVVSVIAAYVCSAGVTLAACV